MYSSGYSQVSKSSPQAQKKMQYRSKGKSCGYYMRIVFFFSSLIQSLIIVSLVLFLVYGKTQDSASTSRIQDLEESFSRLSIENVALRHQRKNLTNLLNTTLTEKARNDWDLARLRYFSNISVVLIQDMDKKLQQTNRELFLCKSGGVLPCNCQTPTTYEVLGGCNCGALVEQLKARLNLVDSNFTQSVQKMTMQMDEITKERDYLNLEAIRLRREKTSHEKELEFFRQRCKEDFALSLSGISNVSKAFLEKIDSLFPVHIAFQLTCPKQREHLEQIRTNCTSLSMEVEDKLQRYLNIVGGQVTDIQHENSRLKAENMLLTDDYRRCSTNRTGIIRQNKQNLDKLQQKHDEEKERLLLDKLRLNGEIGVLKNDVQYRSKMVDHLTEKFKQLNMSCMLKPGFGGFPGGFPSQTGTQSGWPNGGGSSSNGGLGRTGSGGLGSNLGSFGSAFNKPSTGSGSSLFSSGSSSSAGSSFNKPSTGSGSSLFSSGSSSSAGSSLNKPSTGSGSSLFSSGSSSSAGSSLNKPSTGSGSSLFSSGSSSSAGSSFNKPSTGSGSSLFSSGSSSSAGSSLNKPSTGSGSSLFSSGSSSSTGSLFNKPSTGSGSSLSSTGLGSNKPALNPSLSAGSNKPGSSTYGSSSGSSGLGLNKPTSNVKSSSSSGSSSGSTGSASKSSSSSSGLSSWWGMGSSSSSQSKPGSSTGKGPSTGSSSGGTGSLFGAGRSSGLGGGPVSVSQHLRDLQRIINPSGPEEKQDLSRLLG